MHTEPVSEGRQTWSTENTKKTPKVSIYPLTKISVIIHTRNLCTESKTGRNFNSSSIKYSRKKSKAKKQSNNPVT